MKRELSTIPPMHPHTPNIGRDCLRFLGRSEELYSREGLRLLQELPVPEYLRHVTKRLDEENNRLLHYLDSNATR